MQDHAGSRAQSDGLIVVYDGECPFCARYATLQRLKAAAGTVELVDARRGGHPILAEIAAAGLDLDEGMVAKYRGRLHHGGDCVRLLAGLAAPSGLYNDAINRLMRSPGRSRLLYPALRAGRNLALRLLGKGKIGDGRGGAAGR